MLNLKFGEHYEVDGHPGTYNVSVEGNGVHVWCRVGLEGEKVTFKGSSVRISKEAQQQVCVYMKDILVEGYVPIAKTGLLAAFNKQFKDIL